METLITIAIIGIISNYCFYTNLAPNYYRYKNTYESLS